MSDSSYEKYAARRKKIELEWNSVSICAAELQLEDAENKGDPETLNAARIQLAYLHFRQGRYRSTQKLAGDVLRDAPQKSFWRSDALRMLGNCSAELGEPSVAEDYYHQAIDLSRQMDDRYSLYRCLHSLATNIYWPCGQFDLCLAAGKEALSQAKALGLGEELWFPLSDIAWAYWSTNEIPLARQTAAQMQEVITPDSLGDGFTSCLLAGLMEASDGYLQRVLPLYEHARSIAEATGDPGLNMEVRIGLCRAYRSTQDFAASLGWAEDAVSVCSRMNYRQFQAVAWIERGRTLIELGNFQGAEQDLLAASDLGFRLGARFDQARSLLYLAVLLSQNQQPQAKGTWQQALSLIHDNGYDFLIGQERSLLLPCTARLMCDESPSLAACGAALFDTLTRMPPEPLRVKLLGQFTLHVGPQQVSKESLRQRRAGELLALLLSSPGFTLSAEQVVEAMCSQKDTEAAVDFYHHAVSALRRLLEPDLPDRRFPSRYLEIAEERITLIVPAGSEIDALEFDLRIRQKNWEEAAKIYQGEYLPMYRYTEWTFDLRQHFADKFEMALLTLAAEKLDAGAPSVCLELAQRVILLNAWQEQAVALGMQAALAMEDRMTALRLYQRLEKRLMQDLGIAPQAQLEQLYAKAKQRS